MKRIVIDTNVLISALGWDGKPLEVIHRCIEKKAKLLISPESLKELESVLARKQFDFLCVEDKKEFVIILSEIAEIIKPTKRVGVVRDRKDNIFIELAIEAKADHIISGDSDLLDLKEINGINIIPVDEFLNLN